MLRQYDAQRIVDNALRIYKPICTDNGLEPDKSFWDQGWRTNFTKVDRFIACCDANNKRIIVSIPHLNARSEAEFKDTVKHEIAHAMVGPGKDHGPIWVEQALKLNIKSLPCADSNANAGRSINVVETKEAPVIKAVQKFCPVCGEIAEEVKEKIKFHPVTGKKTIVITLKCGHKIEKDKIKDPMSELANWTSNSGKKIFPFQVEGVKFIANANGRALIADEPGLGKAQVNSSRVLTPNGWARIDSIKVGDKVFGEDGELHNVTGIYPQGEKEAFQIKFTDGSIITVCDEHLWAVKSHNDRVRDNPYRIMKTSSIANNLEARWSIPITEPILFEHKEVPIDPYQLGCLLGDGSFSQNQVSIATTDSEIAEAFPYTKVDKITYRLPSDYKQHLRILQLDDIRSYNKFVPDQYKFNSVAVRLAVLQGLMDTDGSTWNNGVIEFTSVSIRLVSDVKYLVESLGGICKLSKKDNTSYTYRGEKRKGHTAYRLIINCPFNPFRLLRKSMTQIGREKKYEPYRAFKEVKSIGKAEMTCISVDNPSKLYVTEHCIVTHNTIQAMGALYFYNEMTPALWVCKSTLTLQAIKEALDWGGTKLFAQIIDSSKAYIMPGLNLYVISMDLLRRMPTEKLESIPFKTVVADEIQHFKDPDSSRTSELRKLVARSEYFIPLSGTPWKNRGSEYYPVLNMLRPELFKDPKEFKWKWIDYYLDKKTGKQREGGIRNIPKFREITSSFVIRRMRDDVLPDLPKIQRNLRFVDMDEYKEKYDKEESRLAAIIKAAMIDGKPMQHIQALIMILKHITGLAKVKPCIEDVTEWLENVPDDHEKITIFHHHIDVGDMLQQGHAEYDGIDKWLEDNDYKPTLRLYGGRSPEERQGTINTFKSDPKRRVLIASTLASGEGLNIQFCQNAYMLERQWNPQNEEQAELRFSRPLTKSELPEYLYPIADRKISIQIPYFIAAGTVDEIITNLVENKRIQFRKSMNVKDEFITWNEAELVHAVAEAIVKKRFKK